MNENNLFLVWNPFQRRAQSLGNEFGLEVKYYHFGWEEKGKVLKAFSYAIKILYTAFDLFTKKPKFVFIQLAPAPLLYIASIYCSITKTKYISDCHNTMIYDSHQRSTLTI